MHGIDLCGVAKGVLDRIHESVISWFGQIERMENKIDKRVNVEVCLGSCIAGLPRKRWTDSKNDRLKKVV